MQKAVGDPTAFRITSASFNVKGGQHAQNNL